MPLLMPVIRPWPSAADRLACLSLIGAVLLLLSSTCCGQDSGGTATQHEFRSPSGQVLAVGILQEVEGNKLKIATLNGNVELRQSELSSEDKAWVRDELKRRKLEREADVVRLELVEANTTGKSHIVYKALRKLRGYAEHAHLSGPLLLDLLKKDYLDTKTKEEVLLTYIATTPLDAFNAQQVLAIVEREWNTCSTLVSGDPLEFLKTYARFGEWADNYLTTVAYTGELKPKPDSLAPPSPRNTELVDETLIRNRAAAARALGELRTERALTIILEILPLVERPDPSKSELEAQKLCLDAIATNGITNPTVDAVLDRLTTTLPEQVQRAREKLAKSSGK